jgi:NAD(P)-dependent dehydrogenase (short-subunit alcohol dehydrogenase family)
VKKVLITGCSRGLGRSIAAGFVGLGWHVGGFGRDKVAVDSLQRKLGPSHFFQTCDVADDEHVKAFCRLFMKEVGPPDLVLNNAGVINRNAPLWEVPAEEFSQLIDINIKGVASVIRHIVPSMIAAGSGIIVNFSSAWGRSTSPDVAPYCASKWAIEGLTNALAHELPPGLAAVALNPGVIDTDMLRSCFGESAASYPSAEQWAKQAVPFLANLGPTDNGSALTAP